MGFDSDATRTDGEKKRMKNKKVKKKNRGDGIIRSARESDYTQLDYFSVNKNRYQRKVHNHGEQPS